MNFWGFESRGEVVGDRFAVGLADGGSALGAIRARADSAKTKADDLQKKVTADETALTTAQDGLKKAQDGLVKANEDLRDAKGKKEAQAKVAEAQARVAEAQTKVAEAQTKVAEAQTKVTSDKGDLDKAETRSDALFGNLTEAMGKVEDEKKVAAERKADKQEAKEAAAKERSDAKADAAEARKDADGRFGFSMMMNTASATGPGAYGIGPGYGLGATSLGFGIGTPGLGGGYAAAPYGSLGGFGGGGGYGSQGYGFQGSSTSIGFSVGSSDFSNTGFSIGMHSMDARSKARALDAIINQLLCAIAEGNIDAITSAITMINLKAKTTLIGVSLNVIKAMQNYDKQMKKISDDIGNLAGQQQKGSDISARLAHENAKINQVSMFRNALANNLRDVTTMIEEMSTLENSIYSKKDREAQFYRWA